MESYNQRKARLLLNIHKTEARTLLDDMGSALRRGRRKEAARIGLKLAAEAQQVVDLRKQLRAMHKEQERIRREVKYNLYAGGNLYTGW